MVVVEVLFLLVQVVLDLAEKVGVNTCDMVGKKKDKAYMAYKVDMGQSWRNLIYLPSDTPSPVEWVDS